jgi:hypothetical protein
MSLLLSGFGLQSSMLSYGIGSLRKMLPLGGLTSWQSGHGSICKKGAVPICGTSRNA